MHPEIPGLETPELIHKSVDPQICAADDTRKGPAVIWKERHNAQNSRLSLIREVEACALFVFTRARNERNKEENIGRLGSMHYEFRGPSLWNIFLSSPYNFIFR